MSTIIPDNIYRRKAESISVYTEHRTDMQIYDYYFIYRLNLLGRI